MADQLTRRDFLRRAGWATAAAVVNMLPKGVREVLDPIPSAGLSFPTVPGDFLPPSIQATESQPTFVNRTDGLPEKKLDDRGWSKEEVVESPPQSASSAVVYDSIGDRYLLHGGYAYGTNHAQTWEFKSGKWSQIEEGSTPGLHNHGIVETPKGIVMFGGVEMDGSSWNASNKFYILKNTEVGERWEELIPDTLADYIHVPALQSFGMVYNPSTQSIWMVAGTGNDPSMLSDLVIELVLPGVWSSSSDWVYRTLGNIRLSNGSHRSLFKPLAFLIPGDEHTYIYGGMGYDQGGGAGIYSTDVYKMKKTNGANGDMTTEKADWPFVDYGGAVTGGYDPNRKQLALHFGHPSFYFRNYYQQSVEFDVKSNSWATIDSPVNPPIRGYPSVAMNPKTGEMLSFGGSFYDESGVAQWSKDSWMLKPKYKTLLPIINSK